MSKDETFKTCSSCGSVWSSMAALMEDESVVYAGYQVSFVEFELGYFLFNHSCGTTFTVAAAAFQSMSASPLLAEERLLGTTCCPGYCLNKMSLEPCPSRCECAFVREIIQILGRRK